MSDHIAIPEADRGGRLQRPPGADSYSIETFAQVLRRHGLTMGLIALLCLLLPGALNLLQSSTTRPLLSPMPYFASALLLIVFFSLWNRRRPVPWLRQWQWILYLLFISVVEEIAFRLVIPSLLGDHLHWRAANIISNLCFASLHYFTLRWRLRNCAFTFLGGMGLSHLMSQGDLLLVILVHWLGTFINTPVPPGSRSDVRDTLSPEHQ